MGEVQEIRSEERYMDADEIAAHYGKTGAHIRGLARKGLIPAYRFGFGVKKFWHFKLSEVERAYRQEAS